MNKLSDAFAQTDKTAALVPFITAGFPSMDKTVDILCALADAGADVIEVGVPFSDPMADGPAIQRANEVALANGVTLSTTLAQVGEFRRRNATTPVVLMGYANSFINHGRDAFVEVAAAAGVNGLIIVDMADSDRPTWQAALATGGISLVSLIAPTTPPDRMREIIKHASGFLYFISLRGVTGAASLDTASIMAAAADIRQQTSVPLAVGFGIRTAQQAKEVANIADGVVIGSRLVEIAEAQPADAEKAVGAFVQEVSDALKR